MTDWIAITEDLLQKHGLVGWKVAINGGRRTVGLCSYIDRTIYLSKHRINADKYEAVYDTVLHEVAHALTPGDGHGKVWKRTFRSMGGSGEKYATDTNKYPSKWVSKCINGHSPSIFRWNQKTTYKCKCGSMLYIKRSDGTRITLSDEYVLRFNLRARDLNIPQIDRSGTPQI